MKHCVAFLAVGLVLVGACRKRGGDEGQAPTGGDAGTVATDAGAGMGTTVGGGGDWNLDAAVEAGGATGDGGTPKFAAIESLLTARAAAAGVTRLGLTIWDARDQKVYEHMVGDFTADTRVAVASASKLVSGLVIFDLIAKGKLSLESTTGEVLGWTGPNAAITLRHLLSFTSGLPPSAVCTANPLTTLQLCAQNMATSTLVAPPGTRFDYGSTHLLVAAAMAERVSGQKWNELFAATLRAPLGLPDEVAYFTAPKQAIGMINPLVAGGMRASVNEYRNFLALAFHKGVFGGVTVGTPALFDEQAKEPFPAAVIGNSPWPSYHYGLASWLACDTPSTGCNVLASPGAFGFTPWYDRASGFYAILGMELSEPQSDPQATEGVVQFAVHLMIDLQPAIAAEFQH